MSAIELLNTLKNSRDPRVSNWTLISSPWPTPLIILTYLSLIYVFLPSYMQNRKPFQLNTIIKVYNIGQIIACSYIIYWILSSGWIQGKYSFTCQVVDYSNSPDAVSLLNALLFTHIIKLLELVETIFFVLRKKYNQVSALHVYHHSCTFTLSWIACNFVGGGMFSLSVAINSFIHVLMYSYYFLASLGPAWQNVLKPWKRRLTIAQMIQFTILIVHGLTILQKSCKISKVFLFAYVPNIIIIYKMFYDFYQRTYNSPLKKML